MFRNDSLPLEAVGNINTILVCVCVCATVCENAIKMTFVYSGFNGKKHSIVCGIYNLVEKHTDQVANCNWSVN